MSYMALYRKWRPAVFDDVKGQDHIVRTLKNQILSRRIGHAYLFCGTRGTGKTSVAKILAKAVNCESPADGSPCGRCGVCRNIQSGASLNVVEIDAASNNGVDNIREIREQVQYPPTEGRYRVYIIDEVHMLSAGAFNALLKTLEEPPSYVIFILATTEVQRIPVTVLSRCQRYDFKRITVETLLDRLKELSRAEQIDVEEKALAYIARAADGSMRDALSLLDQCVSFHFGERLTYDQVLDVLGAADNRVFSDMFRAAAEGRAADCIRQLEELVMQGRELTRFVTDFIWYMRNLLMVRTADDAEGIVDMSSDNLKLLKEDAGLVDDEVLMRYIRVFSELSNQIRYASQKRVLVELALIRLTKPQMERSYDSIAERLNKIEDMLESGAAAGSGGSYGAAAAMYGRPYGAAGTADSSAGGWPDTAGAAAAGAGGSYGAAGAADSSAGGWPDTAGAAAAGSGGPYGAAGTADSSAGGRSDTAGAGSAGSGGLYGTAGTAAPSAIGLPGGAAAQPFVRPGADPGAAGADRPPRQVELPRAQLEDLQLIRNDWGKIVRALGGTIRASFRDTVVEPAGDGCLCVVFSSADHFEIGRRPTIMGQLENYVKNTYGKDIYFKVRLLGNGERTDTVYVSDEELRAHVHADIEEEE